MCAPGTRSQGESTHQLGKSWQWTSCETQRQKTKMVCGILSSCASRSGDEQSTNNCMERDKLMGFQYLIRTQKTMQKIIAACRASILILKVCGRKIQKESAENPVRRISDVTESDSSLINWRCPHLTCSSFTLFLVKVLLMHDNVKYYFHIYLTQIRIKLKNSTGIWRRWDQIFIQKDFESYFLICCDVWLVMFC